MKDEDVLGRLAMRFRGCLHSPDVIALRQDIAQEYAIVVNRLILSGKWREYPAPEDMLTDEYMPKAFFDYWKTR